MMEVGPGLTYVLPCASHSHDLQDRQSSPRMRRSDGDGVISDPPAAAPRRTARPSVVTGTAVIPAPNPSPAGCSRDRSAPGQEHPILTRAACLGECGSRDAGAGGCGAPPHADISLKPWPGVCCHGLNGDNGTRPWVLTAMDPGPVAPQALLRLHRRMPCITAPLPRCRPGGCRQAEHVTARRQRPARAGPRTQRRAAPPAAATP